MILIIGNAKRSGHSLSAHASIWINEKSGCQPPTSRINIQGIYALSPLAVFFPFTTIAQIATKEKINFT